MFSFLTNQHVIAFPEHLVSPRLPLLGQEEEIWANLQMSQIIMENVLTKAETIINT